MLPRFYLVFSALDLNDLYKARGGQGQESDSHFADGKQRHREVKCLLKFTLKVPGS